MRTDIDNTHGASVRDQDTDGQPTNGPFLILMISITHDDSGIA